ncbi:MAG TPA: nitroreductase family protein [Victivallales bacterium]|nr:nitroreductase family protein [Victivallales bacterium]HPO91319.1 nitroreductase family protein [Victivallales bacterium]HRR05733.1 nitroreductase family protein [Victivallales bacterium]HRR28478.1 nitroreductase family protein [Victivallales bacterium]HRU00681.1 nitroreductase family protein [Victivallales bacterium]
MNFFELIRNRRSVRRFKNKKIEEEKIRLLEESALRAPSSRGLNPWKFLFVKDKELIAKFAKAKEHGAEFLKGAQLAVVVCADRDVSDVWIEDCSIASIYIQLAAEELGLGSCWAQIRNRFRNKDEKARDYLAKLLSLPENIEIESIIGIGYPLYKPKPVPEEKLEWKKVTIL